MRYLIIAATALIAGCATSPAALYETRVEETIASGKTAQAFATCVAENLSGAAQLRSDGERYWVLRIVMDVPRHRWDFIPSEGGSIAELRSSGLIGAGKDVVEDCA